MTPNFQKPIYDNDYEHKISFLLKVTGIGKINVKAASRMSGKFHKLYVKAHRISGV